MADELRVVSQGLISGQPAKAASGAVGKRHTLAVVPMLGEYHGSAHGSGVLPHEPGVIHVQEHVGLVTEIEENGPATGVGVERPIVIAHDVSLLEGGLGGRREAEVVQCLIIVSNAARGQVGASLC